MSSLPAERITRSGPFQKVGSDYLGPIYHRDTAARRGTPDLVYSDNTATFHAVSTNDLLHFSNLLSAKLQVIVCWFKFIRWLWKSKPSSTLAQLHLTARRIRVFKLCEFISPEVTLQLPPGADKCDTGFDGHRLSEWYKDTLEVPNCFCNL
ncbi:hypothetical protein ANCDUO_16850 [Ancylostoma duodenale]|uniref:Uncharacterized protein n=1 Tax=Ancylostoma duodenale TaxID=51022 RepID=A0A0C2G2B4_9BILA|nr:hypothetical protein ANCDUO_16850 [Ancylostoma duodenale]